MFSYAARYRQNKSVNLITQVGTQFQKSIHRKKRPPLSDAHAINLAKKQWLMDGCQVGRRKSKWR